MTSAPYKELRLDKYLNLFDPSMRQRIQMALCDRAGVPVWTSDEGGDGGIQAAIRSLQGAGFAWENDAACGRRRAVDAERSLMYRSLRHEVEDFGWVALMVPRQLMDSASEAPKLDQLLDAITNFIEDEYGLNVENELLAGELSRRYEELNLLYSLGEVNNVDFGADQPLVPLLQKIACHIDLEMAAFMRRGGGAPVFVTRQPCMMNDLDLVLTEVGGDLLRFVGADRRPIVLNHGQDPRREFLLTHFPYKFLAAPITREAFEGMLLFVRRPDEPDFENCDRNLAQVIAEQLGTLMKNQAMLNDLRRFGEQLAGTLIEAVEAKDPYTRGHSERVQTISVHIGQLLGLEQSDQKDLYWGSIMHDVGKIAIPDVILSKPGRLTEAEYTFIKTHPERSYEILQHVDYVTKNMLEGARFHHERYDGGGYPRGLRGKEIPLHARIIGVADTYDAMTSSRSYRSAVSHDDAIAEISRERGTQFDSEIADAFIKASKKDSEWLAKLKPGEPASSE